MTSIPDNLNTWWPPWPQHLMTSIPDDLNTWRPQHLIASSPDESVTGWTDHRMTPTWTTFLTTRTGTLPRDEPVAAFRLVKQRVWTLMLFRTCEQRVGTSTLILDSGTNPVKNERYKQHIQCYTCDNAWTLDLCTQIPILCLCERILVHRFPYSAYVSGYRIQDINTFPNTNSNYSFLCEKVLVFRLAFASCSSLDICYW